MADEKQLPSTTTISSDPAIDVPKSSPSTSPPAPTPHLPSSNRITRLRFLLWRFIYRLAHQTDHALLRLSKLLSSPTGTDALLCTFGYTLELLSALGSKLLQHQLTSLATDIAEKAEDVLLPGEAIIATLPASEGTKLLAQMIGSSKALAAVIADFRIFVRMWGLAGLYMMAKGTWTSPLAKDTSRKDKILRAITWGEIASLVVFQVLENGAYLASKGVLTSTSWTGEAGKMRETKWWVWSSRFWAAYVTLEIVRLSIIHMHHEPETSSKHDDLAKDGEKEGKLLYEERKRQRKQENWLWWRDLVSNVAYFPMTLHWSVEEGLLSEAWVGFVGMVAGGALLVDAWKATA